MIKQNLKEQLQSLQLTNSQLVDKLSDIINTNFNVVEAGADSVQDKLTNAHIEAWQSGKAYPTNPVIKDALSILLTGKKGKYVSLVLPTTTDAEDTLVEAFIISNKQLTKNFKIFKTHCINGYFDKIKNNPYSSKATIEDITGCIAYLAIQGYLYTTTLSKKKKLDLNLYSNIVDINKLMKLVDSNILLVNLQKYIKFAPKLSRTGLHKTALMSLLLSIRNQDFFS